MCAGIAAGNFGDAHGPTTPTSTPQLYLLVSIDTLKLHHKMIVQRISLE
jgi:hypothetical protein